MVHKKLVWCCKKQRKWSPYHASVNGMVAYAVLIFFTVHHGFTVLEIVMTFSSGSFCANKHVTSINVSAELKVCTQLQIAPS